MNPRARRHPWWTLLALTAALLSAGCLDFEKQTIVLVFPKEGGNIQALFVYEGLQVGDNNLKNAKEQLEELVAGKAFYLGDPLLRIPLQAEPNEKISPEGKRFRELLQKQLVFSRGQFIAGKDGKLAYCQPITLQEPAKILAFLNGQITQSFLKSTEAGLADPKKRGHGWDEGTLKLVQKAARQGHPWLRLEPGRLRWSMPGTPGFFTTMKRELFQLDHFAQFYKDLDVLAKVDPKEPKIKFGPGPLRERTKQMERILTLVAENPWSFELQPKQMTISAGVGQGHPLTITLPTLRPAKLDQNDKELYTHAATLGVDVRKDVTVATVIEEFKRQGKIENPKK